MLNSPNVNPGYLLTLLSLLRSTSDGFDNEYFSEVVDYYLAVGVFGFWARDRFWGRVVEGYMMQTIDEVSSNFVCYFLVLRVVQPNV